MLRKNKDVPNKTKWLIFGQNVMAHGDTDLNGIIEPLYDKTHPQR